MTIPNLSQIKTRLVLFGSLVTGGAFYHALSEMHEKSPMQAAFPVIITLCAEMAMHLSSHDLHEAIRERGRARDILENEHLTRAVGRSIAALIDEASAAPHYAADRKRLEGIAKYVKENWQDISVRQDADFADITSFQLPTFLTGNAETFLKVTALTPETWKFLLNGLSRQKQGNVLSAPQLAPETVHGVAEKLHSEFAHALFNALAVDAEKNGEAYSKIVLLMLGEILSTNQQTKAIADQIFSIVGMTLTDTGDLLIKVEWVIEQLEEFKEIREDIVGLSSNLTLVRQDYMQAIQSKEDTIRRLDENKRSLEIDKAREQSLHDHIQSAIESEKQRLSQELERIHASAPFYEEQIRNGEGRIQFLEAKAKENNTRVAELEQQLQEQHHSEFYLSNIDPQSANNILVISLEGSVIAAHVPKIISTLTRIPVDSIKATHIEVSDDFAGILDYDSSFSYVELTSGVRIKITQDIVMTTARSIAEEVPSDYRAVGIGFPEQKAMYEDSLSYSLENLLVNIVFTRNPQMMPPENLTPFLHAIMSSEDCDRGYFWNPDATGEQLIRRYIDLHRTELLCDAIAIYPRVTKRSSLIDVGWCLVHKFPNDLKNYNEKIIDALLLRSDELTVPLVHALEKINDQK